jgi:hypothetical protein
MRGGDGRDSVSSYIHISSLGHINLHDTSTIIGDVLQDVFHTADAGATATAQIDQFEVVRRVTECAQRICTRETGCKSTKRVERTKVLEYTV